MLIQGFWFCGKIMFFVAAKICEPVNILANNPDTFVFWKMVLDDDILKK